MSEILRSFIIPNEGYESIELDINLNVLTQNYLTNLFSVVNNIYSNKRYGYGNGYVIIPKNINNPLYGLSYDEIHNNFDIRVHGGLTFSAFGKELKKNKWIKIVEENNIKPDDYIIGFDTMHYFSNEMDKIETERETKSLLKQVAKLNTVENQLNLLIKQIIND